MHCLFLSIFERILIAGTFMEWFCHLVVFHPSTSRVANFNRLYQRLISLTGSSYHWPLTDDKIAP